MPFWGNRMRKMSGRCALLLLLAAVVSSGPAAGASMRSHKRTKEVVDVITQALKEPAGLHGLQLKERSVPFHLWSSVLQNEQHNSFRIQMVERMMINSNFRLQPVQPFRCQVFINHKYKFIYIRHPKTGSTSMFVDFMGGQCNVHSTRPTCMENMGEQVTNVEDAERYWNDYFVYTFVRNPWARASSARDFVAQANRLQGQRSCKPLSFDRFCVNPSSMGFLCVAKPGCCRFGDQFEWHHLQGQARCMFGDNGEIAVDYIGRTEYSETDFKEVVEIINSRRQPDAPRIPVPEHVPRHNREEKGLDRFLARHVSDYREFPQCLAGLALAWWQDVEWLRFPTAGIAQAARLHEELRQKATSKLRRREST